MEAFGNNGQSINLGGVGGQQYVHQPPAEAEDLLDDAIITDTNEYDEDGNQLNEPFSSDYIRNQIKEKVGLENEDPASADMLGRISKYIFQDLQVSSPEEAIKVFARLIESENANSTVPQNVLSVVDQAIRNAQKINNIQNEYQRRQRINDPYKQGSW